MAGKAEIMMIKLNTNYDERNNTTFYRSFRVVDYVPEVGDDLPGEFGYEIINVEQIALDYSEHKPYNAYKVSYIESGFDDEKEEPFIEYLAVAIPEYDFEEDEEDEE